MQEAPKFWPPNLLQTGKTDTFKACSSSHKGVVTKPTHIGPDSSAHGGSPEEDHGSIFIVEGGLVLAVSSSDRSALDAASWGVSTSTEINSNTSSNHPQSSCPTKREASVSVQRLKMLAKNIHLDLELWSYSKTQDIHKCFHFFQLSQFRSRKLFLKSNSS